MLSIRAARLLGLASTNCGRRRQVRECRPVVTALEGRALLSTFVVQNLNDSGTDSLRADLALAQNGDTITFAKGLTGTLTLTSGSLSVSTGVNIKGPGADKLTISGGGTYEEFFVDTSPSNGPVSLSGMTISGSPSYEQGIWNGGASLTLKNVIVTANPGGGILNGGVLTVEGSTIQGNSGFFGGGIDNLGTLTVSNSDISNNTGEVGGGGIYNDGAVSISGSNISDNTGGFFGGGGIYSYGAVSISNSSFEGNMSPWGGAIYTYGVGSTATTITNTSFTANVAEDTPGSFGLFTEGGAINNTGALTITGCQFTGNQAIGASISGIATYGGAIYSVGTYGSTGSLSVSYTTFSDNQALGGSDGGSAYGGALSVSTYPGQTVDLSHDLLTGNSAVSTANTGSFGATNSGDAGGGALDIEAGSISVEAGTVSVESTSFLNNQAVSAPASGSGFQAGYAEGGAIEKYYEGTLTMTNSTIAGNQALGGAGSGGALGGDAQGGGIYGYGGSIVVANCWVTANLAQGGAGGGSGYGGAIQNEVGDLSVTGSSITANVAQGGAGGGSGYGGGIQNDLGGSLTVASSLIIGNVAQGGAGGGDGFGGGINSSGNSSEPCTATITDTLITLNFANGGNGGGQGIGGGIYTIYSTTVLQGKTKVFLNFASTSNNDIFSG
jgi:hypothetical protein